MLFQSWPGETGQLMGIAARTTAWEVFYKSFLYGAKFHGASIINHYILSFLEPATSDFQTHPTTSNLIHVH